MVSVLFTRLINRINGERLLAAPLFLILLFLSNVICIPVAGVPIRASRESLLEVGIIALIFTWIAQRQADKKIPANMWLSGFLVWSVVSTCLHYNKLSILSLHNLVFYGLLYYVVIQLATRKNINLILNTICVAALFQVFWCYLQYFKIDPLFTEIGTEHGWCVGFLDNSNLLAAFLAFSFVAFLRKRWCWFIPFILLPFTQAHMTGGLVAIIAATMVWAMLGSMPRKLKIGLAALSVLVVVLYTLLVPGVNMKWYLNNNRLTMNKRFYYVSNHLKVSGSKATLSGDIQYKGSLLGFGLGQFKMIWPTVGNIAYGEPLVNGRHEQAHNDWLQAKFELGWIGLLIAVGFISTLLIRLYKIRHKNNVIILMAGIVAISVNAFVNFPFHISGLVFIALTYFAVAERIISEHSDK